MLRMWRVFPGLFRRRIMLAHFKKKKRFACLFLALLMLTGCQGSRGEEIQEEKPEGEIREEENREEENQEPQDVRLPQVLSMEDNYRTYYEVFVYSFFDGNGDGTGDLKGLVEKLDYINDGDPATTEDLGCDGIWLMPVMPSASYHKYDVMDYYAIDPEYGTMEDFENFMAECDKRGIKVILDLVINHSSSEHPWFKEAAAYLAELGDGEPSLTDCPYVDYYHFSKEQKTGYSQVPGSDVWYYESQFSYTMPDLNLYNESLREEIGKIVDFWLAKGVGGFRLDAVKEYETGADSANIEILSWFSDMVKGKREDAYLVGEAWTDISTYEKYYESGIDSLFNFAFADSEGIIAKVVKGSSPASGYGKALQNIEERFKEHNPDYIDAPFYTNHDMGRSAGYYSGEHSPSQTKIAGALNLFMSGNAFIYYGEELGMKGSGKDENKRAPMYFYEDKEAEGMCRGPADMDGIKMKYGSYESQEKDPYSVYNYYKKAIRLRGIYPAIRRGSVENLEQFADDTLTAFSKSWEDEKVYLFCNLSPEERVIPLDGLEEEIQGIAEELCVDEKVPALKEGTLTLPGYGIVILK